MSNNVNNTCFSRTVEWFRAPDSSKCSRVVRRTVGIALSILLIAIVIGIAVVVLAARQWKKNAEASKVTAAAKSVAPHPPPPLTAGSATTAAAASGAPLPVQPIADEFGKKLEPVNRQEVLDLQPHIQSVNSRHEILKLDSLVDAAFPKYKMSLDGVTYYISNPSIIIPEPELHVGVVALVKTADGKVYPRQFYHSNSGAIWRCMPFAGKSGGELNYLGKGQVKSDTNLPTSLICALNTLTNYENLPKIQTAANELTETAEGYMHLFRTDETGSKLTYVEKSPVNFEDQAVLKSAENRPNFKNLIHSEKVNTLIYGRIDAEIYYSNNNKYTYLVHRTNDNRIMLSSVEVRNAKICEWGVRVEAFNTSGDITGIAMDASISDHQTHIKNIRYRKAEDNQNIYNPKRPEYWPNWNIILENCVQNDGILNDYYSSRNIPVPAAIQLDQNAL